jgi:hypothetical protein
LGAKISGKAQFSAIGMDVAFHIVRYTHKGKAMLKYVIAGLAAIAAPHAADAAALLTSAQIDSVASVTGPATGRVWNTSSADGYYTLFLQQPFGTTLNPADQAVADPTALGTNAFVIMGEGYSTDPLYKLTLNFADGASISGVFGSSVSPSVLNPTSTIVNNTLYKMESFSWGRYPFFNLVSAHSSTPGGDTSDYLGQFSFSATAVPEPMSWALMLTGFAMIGGALRSRRRRALALATA